MICIEISRNHYPVKFFGKGFFSWLHFKILYHVEIELYGKSDDGFDLIILGCDWQYSYFGI